MVGATSDPRSGAPNEGNSAPLTAREIEILGLLAEGMSGAQIAAKLVLSPETVRTHVRNAMAKLGASTRSQAVALALAQHQIGAGRHRGGDRPAAVSAEAANAALTSMLDGLISLYDVNGGAVYLCEEDCLTLRRAASRARDPESELPVQIALGDGALGRAALERRAQLIPDPSGQLSHGALIAAPMLGEGRLVGVIALSARVSRPVGRSELLLLQALSNRVGEVMLSGGEVERRLERAMERFRASWSASPRAG